MKNSLLIIALTIGSFVNAQYDSEGVTTSRFRPGIFWFFTGYRPAIPEKVRKYDRLMFDLTYNDWHGEKKTVRNHWYSIGWNTSLLFDIPLVKKNLVSLGMGICHGFYSVRHNQHLIVDALGKSTHISTTTSLDSFSYSSLIGQNLSLPIELRFRTKGWKHFKLHLGGKIGYQLALSGKTKYDGTISPSKIRTSVPDVNRLTYSVHLRLGIRNWAFFGSYNLNTLFSNTQSSELRLFQMGLSLSLF